jgi:hypothetical protein
MWKSEKITKQGKDPFLFFILLFISLKVFFFALILANSFCLIVISIDKIKKVCYTGYRTLKKEKKSKKIKHLKALFFSLYW